jgi:uncharacterized membrane protein YfcA
VDLVAAAFIGVTGCLLAPIGTMTANVVDPRLGNILFTCFLVVIGVQMAIKAVRAGRK